MKNNNLDDLSDDELYASYEAFKALLDAGLTKEQALSRTGLTAQIVKDFEDEEKAMEDDDDYASDFKDSWEDDDDDFSDEDDPNWREEDLEEDWDGDDDYEEDSSWDDRY